MKAVITLTKVSGRAKEEYDSALFLTSQGRKNIVHLDLR